MTDMAAIRFATASDGARIAYADSGGPGPALLWTPGWVSNLETDHATPEIIAFYQRLAANHRLLRFDGRGTGLSDRRVPDLSAAARVQDIEAVVDAAGLDGFDLFAWSFWGPTAIIYGTEHRERVRRLALYATFARFRSNRPELGRALTALIRAEWSIGSRTITEFVYPDLPHDAEQGFVEYFRGSASAEVAARILEEGFFETDVTARLPGLSMPVAVLHRLNDTAVSPLAGRELASLVPGARFVSLTGNVHVPWRGDTDAFLSALEGFLGVTPAPAPPTPAPERPDRGAPVTILLTDIAGSTTLTQRLGDARAQELVHTHDAIVRDALRAYGGTEIKHTGDGIMASFPSASAAVECAIAIQGGVAAFAAGQPEAPLQVRIGLNAGEPVREGDDLFGTAVQLARRVCDEAEPGEVLVSNVVRELAAGKGFAFADRGHVALRGFEDPVRLYEVRWAESQPTTT